MADKQCSSSLSNNGRSTAGRRVSGCWCCLQWYSGTLHGGCGEPRGRFHARMRDAAALNLLTVWRCCCCCYAIIATVKTTPMSIEYWWCRCYWCSRSESALLSFAARVDNARLHLEWRQSQLLLPKNETCKFLAPNTSISSVADGPVQRAASHALCCMRRWTLSVINWPTSSVERRPSQVLST